MLRPWPTSATLPLSLLSLILACSSVDAGEDSVSTGQESTSNSSNSAAADASNSSPSDPPSSSDPSDPTEFTSLPDPSGTNGTSGTSDPSTATATTTGTADTDTATTTSTTSTTDTSSSTGPLPESCLDTQKNGDETDIDCGGSCPACTLDQTCLLDTDCDTLSCDGDTCVEATCDDTKKDGAETDIDCGGPDCAVCLDGDSCLVGEDCESAVCTDNICQPAACDDKVKNQDESDVDCGGACDPCANDKMCVLDDDCASKVCDNAVCLAATCSDGVQNGPETGIDCGGPSCAPCQLEGLIINEIDYDQIGTDADEFVEIFNNTGADVDLSDVHLVLVNGSNNATYLDQSLAAAGVLKQGAYLVVGSGTVVLPPATPFVKFAKATDHIQNGSPDGVALIDLGDKKLLDALSYKGAMPMATVTGLGVVSLVEGTALKAQVGDSNAEVGSLIRFPNGNDKNDADTEWIFGKSPTPGAANKP